MIFDYPQHHQQQQEEEEKGEIELDSNKNITNITTVVISSLFDMLPSELLDCIVKYSTVDCIPTLLSTCQRFKSRANYFVPRILRMHFFIRCKEEEDTANIKIKIPWMIANDQMDTNKMNRKNEVWLNEQLIWLIKSNNVTAVSWIINAGIDLNRSAFGPYSESTPLLIASYHGHVDIMKLLLLETKSININETTGLGMTPLFKACQRGHEEIVRLLLDAGANVNMGRIDGITPLIVACQRGHQCVVSMLLQHPNIDVQRLSYTNQSSALTKALQKGHLEIAQQLLNYITSSSNNNNILLLHKAKTDDGMTPLHLAAYNGYDKLCYQLIIAGSFLQKATHNGMTPLMIACERGQHHVVQTLLISIQQQEQHQTTAKTIITQPLSLAIQNGHEKIVKLLHLYQQQQRR